MKCTYCDREGHRQGPACDLWCKHMRERGIPIVPFIGGNQKQRDTMNEPLQTSQLNAVFVSEHENQSSSDDLDNLNCDCSGCGALMREDKTEDETHVLAVTRASKLKQGPIQWQEQEKIRRKVQKNLDKQKPMVDDSVMNDDDDEESDMILKQDKKDANEMVESLYEALLHSGIQISLDQLLTLVPGFRDLLFQKILQKKGLEVAKQQNL